MKCLKIITCILFIVKSSLATGCSCIGTESVEESIKKADKIFSCKVLKVDTLTYNDTLRKFNDDVPFYDIFKKNRLIYTVQIINYFKGGHDKKSCVEIVTGLGEGDCGYEFVIGKTFIVYANWKNKLAIVEPKRKMFLYTDICYRTQLYNEKESKMLNTFFKVHQR